MLSRRELFYPFEFFILFESIRERVMIFVYRSNKRRLDIFTIIIFSSVISEREAESN